MPRLSGRPILGLVTDRHRQSPGAPPAEARRALLALVEAAVDAGLDLVQVRERDLEARTLLALVRDCVSAARGSPTRVVVNDRTDVALAAEAHGVHLRERSVPAAAVRRIAGHMLIVGRSLHARPAGFGDRDWAGLDYAVVGPVFPTRSKPAGTPVLGLDGLAATVRSAAVPVLAIGGVSRDRASGVARTGAAGVAAVDLWLPPAGKDLGRHVSETATAVRRAWMTEETGLV